MSKKPSLSERFHAIISEKKGENLAKLNEKLSYEATLVKSLVENKIKDVSIQSGGFDDTHQLTFAKGHSYCRTREIIIHEFPMDEFTADEIRATDGYKKLHEACADVGVYIELQNVRDVQDGDRSSYISLDISRDYKDSPDAKIFAKPASIRKHNAPKTP